MPARLSEVPTHDTAVSMPPTSKAHTDALSSGWPNCPPSLIRGEKWGSKAFIYCRLVKVIWRLQCVALSRDSDLGRVESSGEARLSEDRLRPFNPSCWSACCSLSGHNLTLQCNFLILFSLAFVLPYLHCFLLFHRFYISSNHFIRCAHNNGVLSENKDNASLTWLF